MDTHMSIIFVIALTSFVTSTNANYIGCFQDNATRILDGTKTIGSMTVEKCIQRCSIERQLYAGVEYANECFCGSNFRPYALLPTPACSGICTGNSDQNCGGFWKISVFYTDKYIGCYEDSASTRILGNEVGHDNLMTTRKCIDMCKVRRRAYAMTQYSIQCFCGDSLAATNILPDSACDHDCRGAPTEKCGGFYRGSLYLAV